MRKRKFKARNTLIAIFFVLFLIECAYFKIYEHVVLPNMEVKAYEKLSTVTLEEYSKAETENRELTAELEVFKAKYPNPTREEIEKYIKLIFGSEARTAIAVSHFECGYTNKNYPKCHLKTQAEHSVGIFQINLYNSKQWIHAGRIPGNTMEEKVLWLENPFNNTLYAYWVFKTSSWNPWSAYTSGRYLQDFK